MHTASVHAPHRRWLTWIALLLVALATATGVFAYRYHGHATWSDAVFSTLQLFHLHFHPCHVDGEEVVPFSLHVARFAAAAVGLGVLPAMLVVTLFHGDLKRWWVRRSWRGHTVVCGNCSRTRALAKDLRSIGRKVVLIGNHPPEDISEGLVHLPGEANDLLLDRAGTCRAAALVAFHDNDRTNIGILCSAERICAKRRLRAPLETHAQLQDLHLQTGLAGLLTEGFDAGKHVRHHVFNYHEIVARLLARQYPLPETLSTGQATPEHYVILGFGSFGQNVALKLVKVGQQLVHRRVSGQDQWEVVRPRVTVVDRRGDVAAAAFLRAYPRFTDHCHFSCVAAESDSPAFLDLSFLGDKHRSSRVVIVLCVEDETVILRTLFDLRSSARAAETVDEVYARLARPDQLGAVFARLSENSAKPRVVPFAADTEVFTQDAVLRQSLDALARLVHESYLTVAAADARANNTPAAASRSWEELSERDRDGNREAADHTWAKLRTLGYRIERMPATAEVSPIADDLLSELASREEELARAEHYRWMTWRLLSGWSHGAKRDNERKLHPDITAYENLPPATQEKDKVIIRAIPQLLRLGRMRARKVGPASESRPGS